MFNDSKLSLYVNGVKIQNKLSNSKPANRFERKPVQSECTSREIHIDTHTQIDINMYCTVLYCGRVPEKEIKTGIGMNGIE